MLAAAPRVPAVGFGLPATRRAEGRVPYGTAMNDRVDPRQRTSVRVLRALRRVLHEIDVAAVRHLEGHGLTPAQYRLLVAIRQRPDSTQQAHADAIGVTKANISQLLSRLEQRGFVTRAAAGRTNAVRLTAAGAELVDRLVPEHDAFVAERFGALDDAELRQLQGLLYRLRSR